MHANPPNPLGHGRHLFEPAAQWPFTKDHGSGVERRPDQLTVVWYPTRYVTRSTFGRETSSAWQSKNVSSAAQSAVPAEKGRNRIAVT